MRELRQKYDDIPGTGLRARLAGFAGNEDGSMIIFGLALFMLMVLSGGMAVDFMRYEAERTRLQATLDRAVLAAASMTQELDPKEVVLDYFDKAGLSHAIDASDITVNNDETARRVEASARLELPSIFLQFADISHLSAPAAAGAMEAASETEISLVLDVSGSMNYHASGGETRIEQLRSAAKKFVNLVMCDPGDSSKTTDCVLEEGKVSITLVPYSQQVVVGKQLLNRFTATSEHDQSNCVTFYASDFSTTAVSPSSTLNRTGHFDWRNWNAPDFWECPIKEDWVYGVNQWHWITEADREIQPVEDDAAELRTRIDNLEAAGATSIDLGMKWGAAFLDPAMNPLVSGLVSSGQIHENFDVRPYSWEDAGEGSGIEKVIVLMTDGENTEQGYLADYARSGASMVWRNLEMDNGMVREGNIFSIYRQSTDMYWWVDQNRWEDHAYGEGTYEVCRRRGNWYSGYWWDCWDEDEGEGAVQMDWTDLWETRTTAWFEDEAWWLDTDGFGPAGLSNQGSVKDSQLQAVCNAAKQDGRITVFTIGFNVTNHAKAQLQACSSGTGYFYDVSSSTITIEDAFESIAREISKLQLIN